jgi:hypothetical protein
VQIDADSVLRKDLGYELLEAWVTAQRIEGAD